MKGQLFTSSKATPEPITIDSLKEMLELVESFPKLPAAYIIDATLRDALRQWMTRQTIAAPIDFSGIRCHFFASRVGLIELLLEYRARVVNVTFADGRNVTGTGAQICHELALAGLRAHFTSDTTSEAK